jgi:hypothetical protein
MLDHEIVRGEGVASEHPTAFTVAPKRQNICSPDMGSARAEHLPRGLLPATRQRFTRRGALSFIPARL